MNSIWQQEALTVMQRSFSHIALRRDDAKKSSAFSGMEMLRLRGQVSDYVPPRKSPPEGSASPDSILAARRFSVLAKPEKSLEGIVAELT